MVIGNLMIFTDDHITVIVFFSNLQGIFYNQIPKFIWFWLDYSSQGSVI